MQSNTQTNLLKGQDLLKFLSSYFDNCDIVVIRDSDGTVQLCSKKSEDALEYKDLNFPILFKNTTISPTLLSSFSNPIVKVEDIEQEPVLNLLSPDAKYTNQVPPYENQPTDSNDSPVLEFLTPNNNYEELYPVDSSLLLSGGKTKKDFSQLAFPVSPGNTLAEDEDEFKIDDENTDTDEFEVEEADTDDEDYDEFNSPVDRHYTRASTSDIYVKNSENKSVVLQPETPGKYFRLSHRLADNQQRERIAICPPNDYPILQKLPKTPFDPCLVVTHIISYGTKPEKTVDIRVSVDSWPQRKNDLEIHPKTPDILSNNLDRENRVDKGETGFYFHIKIFREDPESSTYYLADELTSNVFRTVSHSKLCDNKRRSHFNPKQKKTNENAKRSTQNVKNVKTNNTKRPKRSQRSSGGSQSTTSDWRFSPY